jgi:hypothetical protein
MKNTTRAAWPFSQATERKVSPLGGEIVGYITFDGCYKPLPKTRRKIIAVMPDGTRHTIFRQRHTGWNKPDGHCFTSHLESAKAAWVAAGATIVYEKTKR